MTFNKQEGNKKKKEKREFTCNIMPFDNDTRGRKIY